MDKLFAVVYSEVRGLHQSAYILAVFAFISQLLALVRDRLFAHTFGAGPALDVYYAAFKIPDLLFVLFASMLSVYVLVPLVAERTDRGDQEGARKLLSDVFTVFLLVYALVALVVFFLAPDLSRFFFPGFSPAEYELLVSMLRILLIQPFLLGLSGLLSVATQLGQRFVLYALSPVLYNIGIIAGVLFLLPYMGITGIVWGVVVGALLHAAVQIPFIMQSGFMPGISLRLNMKAIGDVLVRSLPRALTLSLNQLVLIAFIGIASVMAAGSVAVLQFALNLQSVPLAIIGVSYSVAAFPLLSHLFARGDKAEFAIRVVSALRHLFFWSVPAIFLIIVIRAQLVRVILGTGAFDWDDTRLVAAALALFSLSLLAQAIVLLLVRAFYAAGNTRIPFIGTLVASFLTLISALFFYILFVSFQSFSSVVEMLLRVEGIEGSEILMLPLAYSLVEIAFASYLLLRAKRMFNLPWGDLRWSLLRSTIAGLGGGFMAYIALNTVVSGIRSETFVGIFLQGSVAGIVGIGGIVWLLYLMRSAELMELWQNVRRRIPSSKILPADEVDTLSP
jgi:putative peptidoglycan lipid II flippase